jgi:GNAT superfamily N-acetyltransferase
MAVTIELLADYLEHIETLARWHCDEDGRAGDAEWLEFWRSQLQWECGRERIPIAFVALHEDAPIGHVALVEHNMDSHPELSPWLAGTLVHQSSRGASVGAELVRHAVECAAVLGLSRLYLYTERARGFYEKLGWSHLWDEEYEGEQVAVMALDIRCTSTLTGHASGSTTARRSSPTGCGGSM